MMGYNSFGDVVTVGVKDTFFIIIQDINVDKNTAFDGIQHTAQLMK